jgi:uncharacterized membrane protein
MTRGALRPPSTPGMSNRVKHMRTLLSFLKSTVIGGLLVLAPLAILGVIVVKVVDVGRSAVEPVIDLLPVKSVAGVSLTLLLVVAGLLLLCFLAGLLAQAALTRQLIQRVETAILSNVPGYALMKNVGENLVGVEGREGRKTVLLRFEDTSQLGFLMERLADGRLVVFVPGVPNAMAGALHIATAERVEVLDLSIAAALEALGRLGVGLGKAMSDGGAGRPVRLPNANAPGAIGRTSPGPDPQN